MSTNTSLLIAILTIVSVMLLGWLIMKIWKHKCLFPGCRHEHGLAKTLEEGTMGEEAQGGLGASASLLGVGANASVSGGAEDYENLWARHEAMSNQGRRSALPKATPDYYSHLNLYNNYMQ